MTGIDIKKVKCWKITPHHNNAYDCCIIRAETEEEQINALKYAQDRLEQLWDDSASWDKYELAPEERTLSVTMKEIYVRQDEYEDLQSQDN